MINFHHFAPKLGLVAILTIGLLPTGACAGAQTRAEAAIAEAKGKIDAGDKVGAGDQAAELQGQARRALMSAEELLSQHRKGEALAAAHHAGELADEALTRTTNRRNAAERDRRDDLRGGAAAAQQNAAEANTRADSARQETTMANMRADSAEQSSAAANAQAWSLRNAPRPVAPAATTTTVVNTSHN